MKTKNMIIIVIFILIIIALIIGINMFVVNIFGNQNQIGSNEHANTQIGDVEYIDENNNNQVISENNSENSSIVYMTTDISSNGLIKVYEALNWNQARKSSS